MYIVVAVCSLCQRVANGLTTRRDWLSVTCDQLKLLPLDHGAGKMLYATTIGSTRWRIWYPPFISDNFPYASKKFSKLRDFRRFSKFPFSRQNWKTAHRTIKSLCDKSLKMKNLRWPNSSSFRDVRRVINEGKKFSFLSIPEVGEKQWAEERREKREEIKKSVKTKTFHLTQITLKTYIYI